MSNSGTTVFPTALDSFDNPTAGTTYEDNANFSHEALHSQVHDAVEAIESVLGTTAGTSVLKNFNAGQFPVRVTGGGATGTMVSSLVGGSYTTPTVSGGTFTNPVMNGGTFDSSSRFDVKHQANTTNGTKAASFPQMGWGYFQGNDSSTRLGEVITYPVAFPNEIIYYSVNFAGKCGTTASTLTLGSFTNSTDEVITHYAYAPSVTQLSVDFKSTGALGTAYFYAYTWQAWGR